MLHNAGMIRTVTALSLLLVLAACMPGALGPSEVDQRDVIITNAPAEDRVDGLSGRFAAALRDEPACCDFTIHRIAAVELHEPHRDMYAHRGLLSSAAIARTVNAGWAVLVSSDGYRRTVEQHGNRLLVTVETGVKVTIVDSEANEYGSFTSAVMEGRRFQRADEPLVGERREPLLTELTAAALTEVSGPVVARLNELVHVMAD